MAKLGIWGLEIALFVGLGAGATLHAGDDEPGRAKQPSNYGYFMKWSNPKRPVPSQAALDSKKAAKKTAAKPSAAEEKNAAERAREKAEVLRRLEVCDQLTQIAVQNKDEELLRQAQELSDRAWQIYVRRSSGSAGIATARKQEDDVDMKLARHMSGKRPGADAKHRSAQDTEDDDR